MTKGASKNSSAALCWTAPCVQLQVHLRITSGKRKGGKKKMSTISQSQSTFLIPFSCLKHNTFYVLFMILEKNCQVYQ